MIDIFAQIFHFTVIFTQSLLFLWLLILYFVVNIKWWLKFKYPNDVWNKFKTKTQRKKAELITTILINILCVSIITSLFYTLIYTILW